jgi:PAS domain S-box-containing protein
VLRRRVRRLLRVRQAEEALRANEARLSSIVHTATDAIILTDSERRISLFNAAAERMFGWHADEIEGDTLNQIVSHMSDDACAELTRPSIHITNTTAGEYLQCSGRRRDGTEFPIRCRWATSTGRTADADRTIRDITRRKQEAGSRGAYCCFGLIGADRPGGDHATGTERCAEDGESGMSA